MEPSEREKKLQEFISITGADSIASEQLFEAANHNLEQAIELFFSSGGQSDDLTDEQLARRLASEGNAVPQAPILSPAGHWEEEVSVRAPLPVKRDRLYGDDYGYWPSAMRSSALQPPRNEVNAFRDFERHFPRREEGHGARNEGAKLTREAAGLGEGQPQRSRLGDMFQPPTSLKFNGDFEEAKAAAQAKSLWILVNIQSNTEFASHRLNRDTWAVPTLQDIVRGSFIFLQFNDSTQDGQKIQTYYKLYTLPAILVVDPITGSALRTMTGFVPPERLMEDLVPFLDCGPNHPDALSLGQAPHKRRSAGRAKPMTEEEELEMALLLSRGEGKELVSGSEANGEGTAAFSAAGTSAACLAELTDAQPTTATPAPPPPGKKTPEEVQAEAARRLPPEPEGSSACKVAFRLPDGSRRQRVFPKSAPVAVLRAFCVSSSLEAAGGKPFALRGPGAPVLENMGETLEAAGVANAVVSMTWSD